MSEEGNSKINYYFILFLFFLKKRYKMMFINHPKVLTGQQEIYTKLLMSGLKKGTCFLNFGNSLVKAKTTPLKLWLL